MIVNIPQRPIVYMVQKKEKRHEKRGTADIVFMKNIFINCEKSAPLALPEENVNIVGVVEEGDINVE